MIYCSEADIPSKPRDCKDYLRLGGTNNGVYSLTPTSSSGTFTAYCDMTTDGGGWTVCILKGRLLVKACWGFMLYIEHCAFVWFVN